MSVASAWAGVWRGKAERAEVVVERPVVMREADGSEEWTVAGWKQHMIGEGCSREEIAEFERKFSK